MASDATQEGAHVNAGDIRSFGALPVPRFTPDLLSLVRTGEVYSLEQIVEPGVPYWAGHPPTVINPYVRHGDMPELAPASVANEITTIPMHGGTHIDALCHVGRWVEGEVHLRGGIRVQSQQECCYVCNTCGKTFVATQGALFSRLNQAADLMVIVLTLLYLGCPIHAIVAAFGLDERTVAACQPRVGERCQRVHEHIVQQKQADPRHVQADEVQVKMVGKRIWMAIAMAVPSRLQLGGVISVPRYTGLLINLVKMVSADTSSPGILICENDLASYVTTFLRAFRDPVHTSRRGRPRLVLPEGLMLGQVVKAVRRKTRRECEAQGGARDPGGHRGSPSSHW